MLLQPLLDKNAFIIRDLNHSERKKLDVLKFEDRPNEPHGWTIKTEGLNRFKAVTIVEPQKDASGTIVDEGGFGINSLANTNAVQNFIVSTPLNANESKDLVITPPQPIHPAYSYSLEVVPIREALASQFSVTNWWRNSDRIHISIRNSTNQLIEVKIYVSLKKFTSNIQINI